MSTPTIPIDPKEFTKLAGMTPAGLILRYVKDYVGLLLLVLFIIIIYFVIKNGFSRFSGLSNAEDMDALLTERDFLKENMDALLNNPLPSFFELFVTNTSIFEAKRSDLKKKIDTHYKGDTVKAIRHYYVFYKLVQNEDPHTFSHQSQTYTIKYHRFYKTFAAYAAFTGEMDFTGMGEDEKLFQIHQLNTESNVLVTRIKQCGQSIEAFGDILHSVQKQISNEGLIYQIVIPDKDTFEKAKKHVETYKSQELLQTLYKPEFNYENVNEFSWYVFESIIPEDHPIPNYDLALNNILVNYLNSDYETRKKAGNLLIKNKELCDFIAKHPIKSRVYFSEQFKEGDREAIYKKLKAFYAKIADPELPHSDENDTQSSKNNTFLENVTEVKAFLSYMYIAYLHLYIYRKEHKGYNRHTITSIYAQKFKGKGWDFFVEMIKPYYYDFILNRVVSFFKPLITKEFWEGLYGEMTALFMRIGEVIMNIPYKVAEGIQNKRGIKVKEKFTEIKIPSYEGFLGKIFAPIIAVGKFFMGIVKITLLIVKLLMRFTTDPFGVLIDIFSLLVSTLLSILLVVFYAILAIPGINFVVVGIMTAIYFLYFIIKTWVSTVIYIFLFLFTATIILILTMINVMTRGKLNKLIQCQNSPAAWYKTPNYHYRNIYERTFMCAKPCPPGYRASDTGLWCQPIPEGHPNYCPQASIMRIYSGYKRTDIKYGYPDFKTLGNFKYELSLPSKRERKLIDHFKNGRKLFKVCEEPMQNYMDVSKGICANLDAIKAMQQKPFGLNDTSIRRLEVLCKQSYCNSKGTYAFCNKFRNFEEDESSSLIKNICMIILSIVVFTVVCIIVAYVAMNGDDLNLFSFPSLPSKTC